MTETVEYEQFGAGSEPDGAAVSDADLDRVSEIPMELSVEIGRTHMTVGEALQLRAGAVVTLEHLAGDPVDLLVNGSPVARGEVVVIDEQYGLRITEILEDQEAIPTLAPPSQASAESAAEGDQGDQQDAAAAANGDGDGEDPAVADA